MSLELLLQRVEGRLFELGQRLCTDRLAALRDETERLEDELRRAHDALSESRATATATRRRIAAGEIKAALLAGQVETCLRTGDHAAAWPLALELDEVRRQLRADCGRLPCLEIACRQRQRRVVALEQRLGRLYDQAPA